MESLHSQDTVNSTEKQFGPKLVDFSVALYLLNDCLFFLKKNLKTSFFSRSLSVLNNTNKVATQWPPDISFRMKVWRKSDYMADISGSQMHWDL